MSPMTSVTCLTGTATSEPMPDRPFTSIAGRLIGADVAVFGLLLAAAVSVTTGAVVGAAETGSEGAEEDELPSEFFGLLDLGLL